MHPNESTYPFELFIRHKDEWPNFRELTDVNPKPDQKKVSLHVGHENSQEALALRIMHMVSALGSVGTPRDFQAKRYHMIMLYTSIHMDALKKDFIVIDDTEVATVPNVVLAAIHEAFLPEPIPALASLDLKKIIARAKDIERTGNL